MIGADIGTYNLVVAKRDEKGDFVYKREVNAFLELPLDNRFVFNMMKTAGVPLIEREKVAYALGEAACNMTYTMSQLELKRPMMHGCVNPKEKDAFQIMSIMIHSLIDVKKDGEILYYCVPANAINEDTDADYHQRIIEAIFKAYRNENGFKVDAHPINEALALVYAELGKKAFTGIGVSCLCPGTKIYTKDGIKNIEDVKIGDLVLTHLGRWRPVFNVIKKDFEGESTTLQVNGYSGGVEDYKFVDNHELYIKRKGEWDWVGCDDLKIGDIVGEPIVSEETMPIEINLVDRNTCSKILNYKKVYLTNELCELIGYFLGDGSVGKSEDCVQFDFANKETDNIDRVQDLLKLVFDKNSKQTIKGANCTRVKCYSKSIAKWFYENCYDSNGKTCPIEIGSLSQEQCKSLIRGLVMSDGRVSDSHIEFFNTNSKLILLIKQLFSKIGIAASISHRPPRKGGKINNRQIEGKKTAWTVTTCSSDSYEKLEILLGCKIKDSKKQKKKWIENGFCCTYIRKIEKNEYSGEVYDLQVEDDHSFSGPFMTIKNCGAGMVNVCYAMYGNPVFAFSIVNSGDWIDRQAAKATGESISFINREKTKIDLTKAPTSLVERAIHTQYRLMIEHTVQGIKKGFADVTKSVRADVPVDMVIAGGVSSPYGFATIFKETIQQADLPIQIGEIIKPSDPLYAVSRGCLIAAEAASK